MAYFLSIETSTEVCSVCLHNDKEVLLELHASASYQHTAVLTLLIESLFLQSGVKMNQLSAITVSEGPGSYTGLRVGVSTAKGLCYGLDLPLINVNTLRSLGYGARMQCRDADHYIAMIDARRMEVYAQVYNREMEACSKIEAVILDEMSFQQYLSSPTVVFCGNGVEKFKSLISGDHIVYTDVVCNARYMIEEVVAKFKNNDFVEISYFEPMYFKAPNITKSKKNIFT